MTQAINFFQEETSYTVKQKTHLRKWIADAISSEGLKTGDINIILCSDDYLHKMNTEYLDHDTYTDIITFDYSEDESISGDLFISIERVKENAGLYSKRINEELHRVIIHGVLHLCGYGDKTTIEKERMTEKENINLLCRPDQLKVS
jgi:rRNA maturation RNase YbeY